MKTILTFTLTALLLLSGSACKEHHHHDDHSSAELKIITDEKDISVKLTSHTEPIIGFEHQAKSEEDKKKQEAGLEKFENNFSKMISLGAGCSAEKQSMTVEKHGHHQVFEASFFIKCESPVAGKSLNFNMGSLYPEIKALKVDLIQGGVAQKHSLSAHGSKLKI